MLRTLLLAGLLLTVVGIAAPPAQAGFVGYCAAGFCGNVGLPTNVGTCASVASPALVLFPAGYVVVIACA